MDPIFTPGGNTQSFTAATTAPSAVQLTPFSGGNPQSISQSRILNSGSVVVMLGYGATATLAATNAGTTFPGPQIPLLPGTDEIISIPPSSWVTGTSLSSTAVIYVTPGVGV